MTYIDKSSVIDEFVEIGENTKIWHFTHVLKNAKIGKNCTISQGCMIGEGVEIGNGVKIQNGVSVFSGVKIEDDAFIGPSVVFTNVKNPRSFINRKEEFKATTIKKGASIGANSTIICGVTIGEYALIGAGSVVTKDIPNFALVYGNPAKIQGAVDKEGNIIKRF